MRMAPYWSKHFSTIDQIVEAPRTMVKMAITIVQQVSLLECLTRFSESLIRFKVCL